ncbi:MAG TPA: hypothetical protein DEQ65_06505, partial [Ruminococcaceae bacterium]|nr:hypothetical protein [Oscillospiraceae bacterium]
HPHRNDRTSCHSERLRERIRNTLKRETDYRTPCGVCNDNFFGTLKKSDCSNSPIFALFTAY